MPVPVRRHAADAAIQCWVYRFHILLPLPRQFLLAFFFVTIRRPLALRSRYVIVNLPHPQGELPPAFRGRVDSLAAQSSASLEAAVVKQSQEPPRALVAVEKQGHVFSKHACNFLGRKHSHIRISVLQREAASLFCEAHRHYMQQLPESTYHGTCEKGSTICTCF